MSWVKDAQTNKFEGRMLDWEAYVRAYIARYS